MKDASDAICPACGAVIRPYRSRLNKFCNRECVSDWLERERMRKATEPHGICECGCGRPLVGRRQKRFATAYCFHRWRDPLMKTQRLEYAALVPLVEVLGYAAAAEKLGVTKNALIGRMYRLGHRFKDAWMHRVRCRMRAKRAKRAA